MNKQQATDGMPSSNTRHSVTYCQGRPASIACGVDTVSVSLIHPDAARQLRATLAAAQALGKEHGRLGNGFRVRPGGGGAIVATRQRITVGTYRNSPELLFVEGRLASILGFGEDLAALASWRDLDQLPAAVGRVLMSIGFDDQDDWPLEMRLDDRPAPEIRAADLSVRRIDLAVDLRFVDGDPSGKHLLELAAVATLPSRTVVSYRLAGVVSTSLSVAGSRAILARAYDRCHSTGELPGRTVRLETQRRWTGDRRPSLIELAGLYRPAERWHDVMDGWLPVGTSAITSTPGIDGVFDAYRRGAISAAVTERLLGSIVAMQRDTRLWSTDGARRRMRRLAELGITPTALLPVAVTIDFEEIRVGISNAWIDAARPRLTKGDPHVR